MGKIRVVMNKLVYLVQAILNLSKVIMYEFHYDRINASQVWRESSVVLYGY